LPPAGQPPRLRLVEETFVIASTDELAPRWDLAAAGTRGQVELALRAHLAANPGDAGRLQVVPSFEGGGMSDDRAALRFYPWVRRGGTAYLTTPDAATAAAGATLDATVTVNAVADGLTANTTLALVGPADIVGFDARSISRRSPPVHTLDAEPNYFPAVEFDQADLPWRYTPAREDASGRLRPLAVPARVQGVRARSVSCPRPRGARSSRLS
jgi:hypothetical protein